MSAAPTTRPVREEQPPPQARPRRQPAVIHPAARRLSRLFPGVSAWYGTHTRSWWALLPGDSRLLEAPTAEALEDLIAGLLRRHDGPAPSPTPPAPPQPPSPPVPAGCRRDEGARAPGGRARGYRTGCPQVVRPAVDRPVPPRPEPAPATGCRRGGIA